MIAILVAANFGTTWAAIESARETTATNRVLADRDGGVLATGDATGHAPLSALLGMALEELGRVLYVSVTYYNAEYGEQAQHRLTIAQHMKVLSTSPANPSGGGCVLRFPPGKAAAPSASFLEMPPPLLAHCSIPVGQNLTFFRSLSHSLDRRNDRGPHRPARLQGGAEGPRCPSDHAQRRNAVPLHRHRDVRVIPGAPPGLTLIPNPPSPFLPPRWQAHNSFRKHPYS